MPERTPPDVTKAAGMCPHGNFPDACSECQKQAEITQETKRETPAERQEKFEANLKRLEQLALEQIYPPEVKQRQWEAVPKKEALEFMRSATFPYRLKDRIDPNFMVWRDPESGMMFAVPSRHEKLRQVHLDAFAAAHEIAPWAKFKGLDTDLFEPWFKRDRGIYTFSGNAIVVEPVVLESVVNGLADPKYSSEERMSHFREHVAALVHEGVHINNEQDLDFRGPHRVITETASFTYEYLAFPGKTKKMNTSIDRSLRLLRNEKGDYDDYDEALLLGMLVIANMEGKLRPIDDITSLEQDLLAWRKYIEILPPEELANYLRRADNILLSVEDEKLKPAVRALKKQCPQALGHLSVMRWKYLEAEVPPVAEDKRIIAD